jgi:hypothetical protein
MDRSAVINLYADAITYDSLGVAHHNQTARQVFSKVDSITRAEFFDAGRSGLNPEYRITMFFGDYQGESLVGYNGALYSVYRTYKAKTDIIELYVERKGGSNGEESST